MILFVRQVRLALVLAGVDFEDERIDPKTWQELKPKTKFGQLPLLTIDGGAQIAQSDAMLRYAGRLGDGSLYPQVLSHVLGKECAEQNCQISPQRHFSFVGPNDNAKNRGGYRPRWRSCACLEAICGHGSAVRLALPCCAVYA
jgi:hypothetical protein